MNRNLARLAKVERKIAPPDEDMAAALAELTLEELGELEIEVIAIETGVPVEEVRAMSESERDRLYNESTARKRGNERARGE